LIEIQGLRVEYRLNELSNYIEHFQDTYSESLLLEVKEQNNIRGLKEALRGGPSLLLGK
jgi:hypothetical protein